MTILEWVTETTVLMRFYVLAPTSDVVIKIIVDLCWA